MERDAFTQRPAVKWRRAAAKKRRRISFFLLGARSSYSARRLARGLPLVIIKLVQTSTNDGDFLKQQIVFSGLTNDLVAVRS